MITRFSREDLQRAVASRCLAGFIQYTLKNYQMGWVHEEICCVLDEFLQDVADGKSPRTMLTMPPRHGKSEIASVRFPAYALGRYPNLSMISTSYSADLASRMNRNVQRVIDDDLYRDIFPDTALSGKNIRTTTQGSYLRNSDIFEVVGHNGSYRSAGVGGGITGMGGNILLIDDPIKDRAEADSPTIREKVWDWYTSTLYTRLAPGGGIILIQTRWHMDDLAGRLLEAQNEGSGDTWRVINYEAIATKDEKHRKAGEALHPVRYPIKQLESIKRTIGSRDFEALYQQKPIPDGGAIFASEWLKYWTPETLPEKFDTVIMSWDLSFKDTDGSDFAVGQVWGKKGSEVFLLDQVRKRMGFSQTLHEFVALSNKWPQVQNKYIEDKANGPAVIDALKKHISGIIPIDPDGSKTARAYATTPFFEAGNVYLPAKGVNNWSQALIDELLQFPSGAHDDQVDALTQAIRKLLVTNRRRISIGTNFFGGANP